MNDSLSMKKRLQGAVNVAWNWSSCSEAQEPIFRSILERVKPKTILEIGTHQGVSAALMAEYADVVHTVDVLPNPAREQVWAWLHVAKKITEHVHKSQAGRDGEISKWISQGVDLAFIDGSHLMRDVEHDYALCEAAPVILLHDYWQNDEDWPDVKTFCDTLARSGKRRVTVLKPFVLVESH